MKLLEGTERWSLTGDKKNEKDKKDNEIERAKIKSEEERRSQWEDGIKILAARYKEKE